MTDLYYPRIADETAWAVGSALQLLKENPDYLEQPGCPYSEEVKKTLRELGGDGGSVPAVRQDISLDDLEQQITDVYEELRSYGKKVADSSDATEKNTYFRLSATLLEKLLSLKERTLNARKVQEFTAEVIRIMDDVLTPDARTTVMQRLKEIAHA